MTIEERKQIANAIKCAWWFGSGKWNESQDEMLRRFVAGEIGEWKSLFDRNQSYAERVEENNASTERK